MDYQKIYEHLISRAIGRTKKKQDHSEYVYYEKHHIIPKCLGGTDIPTNLVYLTAEEHWVSHLLLVKINPGVPELIFACQAMSMTGGNNQRVNNKLFGWVRRAYAAEVSKRQAGRIVSPETRLKISQSLKGKIPAHQLIENVSKRPEVAAKISEAAKGRKRNPHSDETKLKISNANKGHKGVDTKLNPSYKGTVIATPIDGGPVIRMDGKKQVIAAGFNYQMIRQRVNTEKIYAGYIFTQQKG